MKTFVIVLVFLLSSLNCFSQTLIGSGGGESGNIQMQWSLGEAVIGSVVGTGVTASIGYQQGYLNDKILAINNGLEESLNVLVFPNPFSNQISISIPAGEQGLYVGHIVSLTGNIIDSFELEISNDFQTVVASEDLATGAYILMIRNHNKIVHRQILIKN